MTDRSTPHPQIRLVISGGIGSGKSTASLRLRDHGADVIEADRLGHEVVEFGGAAYDAVAEAFPSVVGEGGIDRGALADIVFGDVDRLRELEALTHPAIAAELKSRVERSVSDVVVVELPIGVDLLGPGWIRVIVEAPEHVRLTRSVGRGFSEEDVRRRMDAQPGPDEWRAGADYVIVNDGSIEELHAAVDDLWNRLERIRQAGVETPDGD